MSYCRFGENDAYIYATYEGFDCCGCSLVPTTKQQEEDFDAPFAKFTTARQILDHIAEHRAAGDHIKESADERIRAEYPDLDAYAGESKEERAEREARQKPARDRIRAKMKAAYEESHKDASTR